MKKPAISEITSAEDFNRWYWTKEELIEFCKNAKLPFSGSKELLRQRISYAFDNNGKIRPIQKAKKTTSTFNWAKEELSLDTKITDNVTFGPNFRNFMKLHIGNKFSCHSDFMDWVNGNIGKTLKDAIIQWNELEERKKDPNFRRKIATHNRMNQYIRDFFDEHPDSTFEKALKLWHLKKQIPVTNGMVKYESGDIDLLLEK